MVPDEASSNPNKKRLNPLSFLFVSNAYKNNRIARKEDDIIFGVPLEQAMQYGSLTSYGFFMPDPVHQCFKEIVKRGLCVEGIFRLSGAASEVEQLQQEFDKPPTFGRYLDLSPYDIHAVAGVMKKYLRSLPEAVIPKALQDQFLDATDNIHQEDQLIKTLLCLISLLPRAHRYLLHYILQLASHIQQYSHINMMNSEALAVVLAPVCTGLDQRLKDIPSALTLRRKRRAAASAMNQFVITNAKWTRLWVCLIEHRDVFLKAHHITRPETLPACLSSSSSSSSSGGPSSSPSFINRPAIHRPDPVHIVPSNMKKVEDRPACGVVVMRRKPQFEYYHYKSERPLTSMDDLDQYMLNSRTTSPVICAAAVVANSVMPNPSVSTTTASSNYELLARRPRSMF